MATAKHDALSALTGDEFRTGCTSYNCALLPNGLAGQVGHPPRPVLAVRGGPIGAGLCNIPIRWRPRGRGSITPPLGA